MNPTSPLKTVMACLALSSIVAVGLPGCKKDEEPPPPLPSATPVATPETDLQLVPEDAGTPDADVPKTTGGGTGPRPASLKKCCDALTNNAKSAPPPNDGFLLQAAAVCNGMAATGLDKGAALAAIRGALKGIQMPAGCL